MGTHGLGLAAQEPFRLSENGRRRSELYGRRLGRPLSVSQQILVETLLPRIAVPDGAIDLRALFPKARAFAFEVGFGGGEHLAAQAAAHPDIGYIGCEPFLNGVAKLLTQVDQAKLTNVRLYPDDARDVLLRLSAQSLSAFYVLFPDPWPKLRHHKRRFIQKQTLDELARVLKPGAELRVATDHPDYARWALQHLMADIRFRWTAECAADWRVRPADWPPTRYEQKALKVGRACVYLRFLRV
ncbi:MAG: tRNA (guanosine(46)-N7)-methyltransferase TrmB [Micropepsaceae bacterium]